MNNWFQQQFESLLRLPGQQYDEETGLYYNRHRYYNPEQGRYITQDPIGLRGGWNLYAYPLNPVQGVDPLGLDEGDIFSEYDNSAADTLDNYLNSHGASPEERVKAGEEYVRGVGGWNPAADYVKLWAIDTPVIIGTILTGPASSLSALSKGTISWGKTVIESATSCAAVATTSYMDDKKIPDKSELTLCALGGAFGAGKGFLEKTAMKMGLSFLSQGADIQAGMDAAANTGVEEVVAEATGKLPFVPENEFGDAVTDFFAGELVGKLKDDNKK